MKEKLNADMEALLELSKLHMAGKEKESMAEELCEFVEFLGQVREIEMSAEEVDKNEIVNVFRCDEADNSSFGSDEMLFNAKTKTEGYITVPRVVGEENG